MKCIISCEHASNHVDPRFSYLFRDRGKVLSSHQAYDAGTAGLACRLAEALGVTVHLGNITRLLIDLNRSSANRRSLYSTYSRKLGQNDRAFLLQKYYQPYREEVGNAVAEIIAGGNPVLHISIHSFTPVKDEKERNADIGLLYDPARSNEKNICRILATFMRERDEFLRVRRNYPYLGKTDGFTSFLRRRYPENMYAGIEIELNQALLSPENKKTEQLEENLTEGLGNILQHRQFPDLMKKL